jgi:hypothetical protein
LTQLTNLVLLCCSVPPEYLLEVEDIMLLSALTQLREFHLTATFSDEAMAIYFRHMRHVCGVDVRNAMDPADDGADDAEDDAEDDAADDDADDAADDGADDAEDDAADDAAVDAAIDAAGDEGQEVDSDDEL